MTNFQAHQDGMNSRTRVALYDPKDTPEHEYMYTSSLTKTDYPKLCNAVSEVFVFHGIVN